MADDQQSVAQDDEQDFAIPGQQNDENQPGPSSAPPGASAPVSATPSAAATLSTSDPYYSDPNRAATDDQEAPKASGRAMFLGNLLKTILSGAVAGMGQSPTPFGRAVQAGSQAADPMAQQLKKANVEKAMSEADQAKIQTSVTGMKALQTEYMLKRLPLEDQIKHMEVVSKFKDTLIKEGANVEAEADDEKSSDAQAMHLNGTDPRALNHSGHFWSLPTMDAEGKAKFDVVYVPAKDVLQNDFTWKGADGQEHTISAGTPMLGLPKMVEQLQKDVQGDTKEQHKQMAEALGPVTDEKAGGIADWLERGQKANDPLYQQNKTAVDAAIPNLRAQAERGRQDKLDQAKAMSTQVRIPEAAAKSSAKNANNYYHWEGSDGETHVGKGKEVPEGVEPTPIGGEKEFAQYTAESHISNIVQQSLNRIHQDIDEHPELFDNAGARNVLATSLEQIDRASAGILIAGTGGSVPLPSGLGAMINTALQNGALNASTADAVKQYIADYKAMKDKAISMQMEMQGGKIGRGSAQAFKSITDQIPNGETADSRSAHRQMQDLQETQDELSKKYGNYGDFKKIAPYKSFDKGKSSTSKELAADREKQWETAGPDKSDPVTKGIKKLEDKGVIGAIRDLGEKEKEIFGKLFGK